MALLSSVHALISEHSTACSSTPRRWWVTKQERLRYPAEKKAFDIWTHHHILELTKATLCCKKYGAISLKDKASALRCWLDTHTHTLTACSCGVQAGTVVTAFNLGGQRWGMHSASELALQGVGRWGFCMEGNTNREKGKRHRGVCALNVCILWAYIRSCSFSSIVFHNISNCTGEKRNARGEKHSWNVNMSRAD